MGLAAVSPTATMSAADRLSRSADEPSRSEDASRTFAIEIADLDLVFRRYYERIYRYCRQRTRSAPDAEDLASQVFTEAMRALPRMRWTGRPVLAILYAIARHRLIDYWRAASRMTLAPLGEALGVVETNAQADEAVGHAELRRAIADLPDDQRSCVVLQLVHGYSFAEVGSVVGRSEKACKSLAYRGHDKLRASLTSAGVMPATTTRKRAGASRKAA
jgi:RNA polymerase sigma-70 factor, ECF subfamily